MSYVVGGTSTYSKGLFTHLPHYPKLPLRWADGVIVKDAADELYLDWTASLGAVLLGYRVVDRALEEALHAQGWVLPLPGRREERAAKRLCIATGWDQVRWCKNGSDATEAAVRLARSVTERKRVLTNSYHGFHSDLVTATPGKAGGILSAVAAECFPVADPQELLAELARQREPIAAVIAEPLTPACQSWPWEEIKAACVETGTLLIFDEIITGFRCRLGSAYPAVRPDLACYGKAIANGMPLACVAGPAALMGHFTDDVFFSATAATENLSFAACIATLDILWVQEEWLYRALQERGYRIGEALKGIAQGYPQRWTLTLPKEQHEDFVDALAVEHILVGRDFFVMAAHSAADVERTCLTILRVRKELGL